MNCFNRKYIFQPFMFRGHVSFFGEYFDLCTVHVEIPSYILVTIFWRRILEKYELFVKKTEVYTSKTRLSFKKKGSSSTSMIPGFQRVYPFSHNHGSEKLPQMERKLILDTSPFPLNHSCGRSNFTTQTIKLNPQKPQKLEPRNISVGWFTKKLEPGNVPFIFIPFSPKNLNNLNFWGAVELRAAFWGVLVRTSKPW